MAKIDTSPEALRQEAMSYGLMAWSENLRAFDDVADLLNAVADRIEELEDDPKERRQD